MRNIKTRLFLYLLFSNILSINLFAEDWPTLGLPDLIINSNQIVEAKLLKIDSSNYFFLYRDIHSKGDFKDTFCIQSIDRIFAKKRKSRISNSIPYSINFSEGDAFIFFIHEINYGIAQVSFSGYRVLKNETIYQPFQFTNPGNFNLSKIGSDISWTTLINRILKIESRIDSIIQINAIQNAVLRNQLLFEWLENNANSFYKQCGLNEDCGWGMWEYECFDWVSKGNIMEDTWRVSQLYRSVMEAEAAKENQTYNGLFYNDGHDSFFHKKGIDFLVQTALDSTNSISDRQQALYFLGRACRFVYKRFSQKEIENLSFQPEELQNNLLDDLSPLLENEHLKGFTFQIMSRLSNPRDGNLSHRLNLKKLPLFLEFYQKEKPSEFKNSLGEFIVFNVSEAEWKEISGNDKRKR